ncbi:MAG: Mu transposase C-terminal domain-containing protein, partial [Bacillota bacterium]
PEDLPQQLAKGHAPKLEEFAAAFARWIEVDYHARGHSGDGMDGRTPAQVWATCLSVKRTATPETLDLLLQPVTKPVTVSQNGVRWNGLLFGQYEPALRQRINQEVRLRVDPANLAQVTVWTLDDQFICVAPANRKLPANATAQELREAMAQKRQDRKRLKDAAPARMRMALDLNDRLYVARAEKQSRNDEPTPPPAIQPVRTVLEDQLPALRKAMQQLRPAVGAESISAIDMHDVAARMRSHQPSEGTDASADSFDLLRTRLRRTPHADEE